MNIFLLPYTWLRHLSMAYWCASAGLMAWWVVLFGLVVVNLDWPPGLDGPILMATVSMTVAAASILGEANLRRLPIWRRVVTVATVMGISGVITTIYYYMWHGFTTVVTGFRFFHDPSMTFNGAIDYAVDASDASLVSITFRMGAFAMGGLGCGTGCLVVRKFQEPVSHLAGGLSAGLLGGIAWYVSGLPSDASIFVVLAPQKDLFLAGALMGLVWGFSFGLLAWSIPDELYVGWLRVLTPNRFARRIPVDGLDGKARERFVGHFPRGLDLFLPIEDGVQELHLSVTVNEKKRYTARGLSQFPTTLRSLLNRVDIRYDPRQPVPVETTLASGDRIVLGEGEQKAEVEFILLPREEV